MEEGSEGGEKVLVVSANVRSSQERRKIYMLAREMDDASKTTEHMAVIMAVQETWLKSQKARTEISQERGMAGWQIHRLDRARICDHRSGGIAVCVKGNGCNVRSQMVDNLGAMRTDIVREVISGDTKETIKVAIINVYVPTGVNKLAAERERVMEHRIMGAVKHVMEGMENIIVTGDWNHLTNRRSLLSLSLSLHETLAVASPGSRV